MLKQTALLFLLLGRVFSQTYTVEVHLDDIRDREVKCTSEVPKDFGCAIFFDVDPPIRDAIDIASVVGGKGEFPSDSSCPSDPGGFSDTRWYAVHRCVRPALETR